MTITTRAGKGTPLTNAELDANFTDLRDLKAPLASPSFTGGIIIGAAGITTVISADASGAYLEAQGANHLRLYAGSAERLRVASSGNILIGSTTDNGVDKIQITGSMKVSGNIQQDNATYLQSKTAAGTVTRTFGLNSANVLYIGGIDSAISDILFLTTSERMRIAGTSGNVLIGTATDDAVNRLQVAGKAAVTENNSGIREILSLNNSYSATSPGPHGVAIKLGYAAAYIGARIVSGGDPASYAAGYVAFERGAGTSYSESARFSVNGNLLIGTAIDNAVDKLQVAGSIKINSSGTYGSFNSGSAGSAYLSLTYNGAPIGYIGQATGTTGGGGNLDLGIRAEGILSFASGAAERMRISAGGRVLIGTVTDNGFDKLQLVGTQAIVAGPTTFRTNVGLHLQLARGAQATQAQGIAFTNGVAYDYLVGRPAGTDDLVFGADNGLTLYEAMRLKAASGNVLIGTTADNASDKLQVNGSAQVLNNFRVTNGTKTANLGVDVNGQYLEATGASNMRHFAGGAEQMRLMANGNLLLGTTVDNGVNKLQVNGSAVINAGSGVGFTVNGTTSTRLTITSGDSASTAYPKLEFIHNGNDSFNIEAGAFGCKFMQSGANEKMRISAGGSLLVGRTTVNAYARLVVDSANAGSAAAAAGWIAGDFGGSGTSTNRVVVGSYGDRAIVGAHNNNLTAWATLYLNDGGGNVIVGTSGGSHLLVGAGLDVYSCHTIQNPDQTQANINFLSQNSFFSYVGSGAYGNNAASSMKMNYNTTTGRSLNAGGTVNASGADYAEYMHKADACGVIAKGAVVGVDAAGQLTDQWAAAVSFVIKSTDPSYVGGDRWGVGLEGEELEAARAKVDRIAFAGQVPVNVWGAAPGMFIVPVQVGEGIDGRAVLRSEMTLDQYVDCVGIVQNILPDGRANIRVKVA